MRHSGISGTLTFWFTVWRCLHWLGRCPLFVTLGTLMYIENFLVRAFFLYSIVFTQCTGPFWVGLWHQLHVFTRDVWRKPGGEQPCIQCPLSAMPDSWFWPSSTVVSVKVHSAFRGSHLLSKGPFHWHKGFQADFCSHRAHLQNRVLSNICYQLLVCRDERFDRPVSSPIILVLVLLFKFSVAISCGTFFGLVWVMGISVHWRTGILILSRTEKDGTPLSSPRAW